MHALYRTEEDVVHGKQAVHAMLGAICYNTRVVGKPCGAPASHSHRIVPLVALVAHLLGLCVGVKNWGATVWEDYSTEPTRHM